MKFYDLEKQQKIIKKQIQLAVNRVMTHGQYILGPEVEILENTLAEYVGVKYCISCANGTDALQIALMALDIGPGDEVVIPGFTYISAVEVVKLLKATPVFVDICEESNNMNPAKLRSVINENTKAIIPTSLYGLCADFDEINRIADEFSIPVIEDAAQSFGAVYKAKRSCNLSTIATTSFFPSKPLGCYGDGGAIFTNSEQLSQRMRMISTHGQYGRYNHVITGVNSRLDTMQAAIILEKLKILDNERSRKEEIARLYNEGLSEIVKIPNIPIEKKSAWAQYTIKHESRDLLEKKLREEGVPTAVHYPKPLYKQQSVNETGFTLAISESNSKKVLSLPMHAYLEDDEVLYIIDKIRKIL